MKYLVIIFLMFSGVYSSAQFNPWIYQVNQYNFIRYDLNQLQNFGDEAHSELFFKKLDKLISTGEGRINIVQIGGSHIQAGVFSGQIRTHLQQLNGEMNAGFGFMFPYRMARTNAPFGYYIRYTGNWQTCRNVETRKTCSLGAGGIAATTSAESAELTILLEKENTLDYSFKKLKLFFDAPDSVYSVSIDSSLMKSVSKSEGLLEFELHQPADSLTVKISKPAGATGNFTLYGIITESASNGFLYHSIGINGAQVPSFLRCDLFEQQLTALKPDLVILGLGINDAYSKKFSPEVYEENYAELVTRIRRAAPETAIIFITNNDSYLYRRYVNKNGQKVEQSLLKLSLKLNTGIWDMYEVMGGLNSIVLWEKNNLAQRDKIHFTREGYLLMGDLFFNALMQNFETWHSNNYKLTQHKN